METTLTTLKPCPFCGSAAELRTSHGWHAVGCGTTMKCPAHIYALTHRSEADAVRVWNTRTPGVKTGAPRGPVHSCKNCAHLAKGSCDEPCAGCTVRWRSGVSDRWEPAYGVPGSEPLRHATTWSGDCPHWCRACAAERARTDGVPDTDGRQE